MFPITNRADKSFSGKFGERRGKIGYFTIRNGSVNSMTLAMHKQFYHMLLEFLADDEVSVGILQGAGDRAFSAGDDIKNDYRKFDTPMEELKSRR